MTPPRTVLTIAGSDSGGGAGIQADLKTFAAHGVYGLSAITAVTAQSSLGVRAVAPVPPAMVGAQIDAVLEDFGADAVKIGMLWSADTVRVVAARLQAYRGRRGELPIVLDPVMAASSGAPLLAAGPAAAVEATTAAIPSTADPVSALIAELLPLATLITPNLPELAVLAARLQGEEPAAPLPGGLPAGAARLALARQLARRCPAVLAKGGHDPDPAHAAEVVDLLVIGGGEAMGGRGAGGADGAAARRGERLVRFAGPRLATRATHGTGCTLSAAIAARLAAGEELAVAVGGAIEYVRRAMAAAPSLGGGAGPLAHFHDARFHGRSRR